MPRVASCTSWPSRRMNSGVRESIGRRLGTPRPSRSAAISAAVSAAGRSRGDAAPGGAAWTAGAAGAAACRRARGRTGATAGGGGAAAAWRGARRIGAAGPADRGGRRWAVCGRRAERGEAAAGPAGGASRGAAPADHGLAVATRLVPRQHRHRAAPGSRERGAGLARGIATPAVPPNPGAAAAGGSAGRAATGTAAKAAPRERRAAEMNGELSSEAVSAAACHSPA